MTIIKIIPAKRTPISLSLLDYSIPKELEFNLKIGQLVKIPLRKQEIFGIIKTFKNNNNVAIKQYNNRTINLKPITNIVINQPLLSSAQLSFLSEMSEFYHTSLGFLVKNNLLPLQKTKLKKLENQENLGQHNNSATLRPPSKPILFTHSSEIEKYNYISKNIKNKSQSLILVPELKNLKNIQLTTEQQKKVIYITSELSNKELFANWQQIWQGKKTIIIGTRRALFLPYYNLTNIFLTDEGNLNYKSWDMSPRFYTRDACLILAKHHTAQLHLLTHTPSVETYFFAKKEIYRNMGNGEWGMGNETIIHNQTLPTIIDMRIERKKGNYDFMSEELIDKIHNTKGNIFLFLNKRGTANFVGCRDCGEILRCDLCNNTLTYHQDKNILKCHYCRTSLKMPKFCKRCHGLNLVLRGPGTQMVENKIQHLFQNNNSVEIIRIDSDADIDTAKINNKKRTIKIIIGTQMAWSYINWQKLELMIFVDADSSLFIPEYKISESLFHSIRDAQYKLLTPLSKRVSEVSLSNNETMQQHNNKIFIQTSHPDHPVFKYLSNPTEFYNEEIKLRQTLQYPPFRFILKLFYGNQNKFTVQKEANGLMNKLTTLMKDKKQSKIIGPIEPTPYFNKGKYWQNIIIKLKYDNYKHDVKHINSLLPIGWKVDPNPNSLLSI